MSTLELRADVRMSVSLKGALNSGDTWSACRVLDMSDSGFLIICSKELLVGQVLDFRCELYPEKTLTCKIEIRHVSDTGVGSKIVEIDEKGSELLQLFLQEQYSHKLDKSA